MVLDEASLFLNYLCEQLNSESYFETFPDGKDGDPKAFGILEATVQSDENVLEAEIELLDGSKVKIKAHKVPKDGK